ncbi:MAG: FtsQ-type POTRA domain-containing protein [Erythrobacter sp.]|nr:FtsQ-type POTRA domain-containing protein [Erythrobacter sp.]
MALIIGAALVLVGTIASLSGLTAMARAEYARTAGEAGFALTTVRVTGTERMDEARVYALAMEQKNRPMPDIDIVELREAIKQLDWVEDARVSIQLPDTLAIDIVERVPHALLQKSDGLVVIDKAGHELPSAGLAGTDGMLRVGGAGVSQENRMAELANLFATAPAIEAQVKSVQWVGNRRWDLTFQSDQVLMLPEGKLRSIDALKEFAELDGQYRLIGGKVERIDMRDAPRVYLREPGRADRYELAAGPQ